MPLDSNQISKIKKCLETSTFFKEMNASFVEYDPITDQVFIRANNLYTDHKHKVFVQYIHLFYSTTTRAGIFRVNQPVQKDS